MKLFSILAGAALGLALPPNINAIEEFQEKFKVLFP